MTTTHPHDRAFFRLRYPRAARPEFRPALDAPALPVVDCSEGGFRFRTAPDLPVPAPGEVASGEIHFRSGHSTRVAGVVVRVQDEEVAVHLTELAIPFAVVLQEQRFVRQRYPWA